MHPSRTGICCAKRDTQPQKSQHIHLLDCANNDSGTKQIPNENKYNNKISIDARSFGIHFSKKKRKREKRITVAVRNTQNP